MDRRRKALAASLPTQPVLVKRPLSRVGRVAPAPMKSVGSCWLVITLAAASVFAHLLAGSPAGLGAYVFAGSLIGAFVLLGTVRSRASVPALSLTNLLWAWLVFECLIDGYVVSGLGVSVDSLYSVSADAYSRAYWVGTAAIVGMLLSSFTQNGARRPPVRMPFATETARVRIGAILFGCVSLAGIVSLIVLLQDDAVYDRLLYQSIGFAPRVGLGGYSAFVFILPTSAIAAWFLFTHKLRSDSSMQTRVMLASVPLAISLLHLLQGRRLVWASTVMMVLYVLHRRRLVRVRLWWAVAASCLALPVFGWLQLKKNTGFADVFQPGSASLELLDFRFILRNLHEGIGRFDLTAALIDERNDRGLYWGATLLQAPLHALPTGFGLPRPPGVREDIGRILYGEMGVNLVSQEPSLMAELYCNFGYVGLTIAFFVFGALCKMIDVRWAQSRDPIIVIAYSLCLFRLPHQLLTASSSWFPLTFYGLFPLMLVGIAIRMLAPGHRPNLVRLAKSRRLAPSVATAPINIV